MLFVRTQVAANRPLIDPLASTLMQCVSGGIESDVDRFLGLTDMFSASLARSRAFCDAVHAAHTALRIDPLRALG
jgi:hypothetical protein